MPIFRGFTDRLRGSVALALQEQVAEDIDRLVQQVLEASVALWRGNNWTAYDDEEENYTVQLYRWCREASRLDSRFALLAIHLEWVNVTAAMLAGTESVKSASRPDLRIDIGSVGRAIECKRLAPTGGWTRAYVYQGLVRFVLGDYGQDESVGYMVGYAQAGTLAELLMKINQQIFGHPAMGAAHQLRLLRDDQTSSWSRSDHTRASRQPIRVDHLMVHVS